MTKAYVVAAGVRIIIPHITMVEPLDDPPAPVGKGIGLRIKVVGGECVFTFDSKDAREESVRLLMNAITSYYEERGEKSHGKEEEQGPREEARQDPEGGPAGLHRRPAQEEGGAG